MKIHLKEIGTDYDRKLLNSHQRLLPQAFLNLWLASGYIREVALRVYISIISNSFLSGLRLTWGGASHGVKVEVGPGVILGPDPGDHHQDCHRGHADHGQIVTEAEAHQHVSLASLDT